ncbi:phosphotransferase [Desulfogranum marinum]|uniref:phosphotransferase n=1 Tax=Desulfogranum marinum TaxID=453220 RepID=UPI0029C836AC|nr:phosphotransferase [Desulfogranum marinum]
MSDNVLNFDYFPEALRGDLDRLGLSVVEVLFFNLRKGRWTLKVKRLSSGDMAVLKWCHPEADEQFHKGILREKAFYQSYGHDGFTPKLLQVGNQYLLLEYLSSKTLRQSLIEVDNGDGVVEGPYLSASMDEFFRKIYVLYDQGDRRIDLYELTDKFVSSWRKLLLSGPMNTERSKGELFLARVLVFFLSSSVKRKILRVLEESYNDNAPMNYSFVHGDMHCNNIIIDSDMRFLLLDFEEVSSGYWMADFLYLMPMVFALNRNFFYSKFIDSFKDIFQLKGFEEEIFDTVMELNICAVCLNSKFAPGNNKKFFELFLSSISLVKKII